MIRFLPVSICLALLTNVGLLAQSSTDTTEAADRPLDALLAGETVWQMSSDQFEQTMSPARFQWLSEAKDQARFFGKGLSIWNGEVPLTEAIVEFHQGKVARLNLSIFNRGDSSEIAGSRDQFEKQVARLRDTISAKLGVPGTERGKDKSSAVAAEGIMWIKQPSAYLLEYSFQREVKTRGIEFRPEFIRLRAAPVPGTGGGAATAMSGNGGGPSVSKASLSSNLKHESTGDVLIANVPMVDQGPKGYCAVATAERVFRYYGIPVDQHEMAQVADTAQGGGTSPDKMYEALNKLEGRLRVRVRVVQDFDFKQFLSLVEDYNRMAKRASKKEVSMATSGVVYIDQVYGQMDGEVLKATRTERDRAGYGKFQRSIVDLIDKGVPVMWSVMLGLLPEKEIPQAAGGHMRLIIGYNTKTGELLYSDSWGAEHALKRMPMANAYAMTTGLYYMEPMK